MTAAEMLTRLDEAKEVISSLPPNTSILTVEVDGLGKVTEQDYSYIHIAEPLQLLADAGVIEAGSWVTEDNPELENLEDRILINGFSVIYLRKRNEAAPGP